MLLRGVSNASERARASECLKIGADDGRMMTALEWVCDYGRCLSGIPALGSRAPLCASTQAIGILIGTLSAARRREMLRMLKSLCASAGAHPDARADARASRCGRSRPDEETGPEREEGTRCDGFGCEGGSEGAGEARERATQRKR
eukprot:5821397-Pleurochrysis_carterae.AAC.1